MAKEYIKKAGDATPSDWHVDTALTDISVAYKLSQDLYIADKVFPTVQVEKQSDKIFMFDKNDFLRNEAKKRAPGTESAGGGFAVTSTTTYFADVHAFHKDISNATLANTDIDNLEVQVAEYVTQKLLIEREVDFVTNFFATNLWADQGTPNDATGHATNDTYPYFIYFSDGANSDPLGTVTTARENIISTTGYDPNTLIVGLQVHNKLRLHPDIKEQVKYTQSALASNAQLAEFFGVKKYLVGSAPYATNTEGGTAAYSFAFGKHMLLAYVPEKAGLLTPSAGYIFEWTGLSNLGYNVRIKTLDVPLRDSKRIEGEMAYDAKLLCSDLGVFFNGAVA